MKTRLTFAKCPVLLAGLLVLSVSGCQGGLPSLANLNKPTRVPPPPLGSFQIPPNYADPSGGGATKTPSPTLGQLRSLETGKPVGNKIESDGLVASDVTNGTFASKPFVGQAVSTNQSSANQFNRSLEAAASAFAVSTGASSAQAPNPGVAQAGANETLKVDGPAVVQAAALSELPDPRYSEASHAAISSDESIKWKSSQR
jgi:hypothetical protein